MERIITALFLFTFCILANAQEQVPTVPTKQQIHDQQQQQQKQLRQDEAGGWVNDWWENVQETQTIKNLNKEEKLLCERKLTRYKAKVKERPTSEYYKAKLKKWTKRCADVEEVDKPVE